MDDSASDHLRLELDLLEGELPARQPPDPGAAPDSAILILAGEKELRDYIARCIRTERPTGVSLLEASGGRTALRLLEESPVDLIVAQSETPGLDDAELCRRAKADSRAIPVLLILNQPLTTELEAEYLALGADRVLSQVFNAAKLCAGVHDLLNEKRP